jgi:hypothetical protein
LELNAATPAALQVYTFGQQFLWIHRLPEELAIERHGNS